jgi:hypothetical protein
LTLSAAGVISGTPTTAGTFNGTVTASNGVSPNATQNFSITVTNGGQAPHFTDGPPPSSASVGVAYSFTYTASGSPTPTFSLTSGALPGGLTLSAAGVISGTPTKAGTFTGTVTASNGVSPNATQNFSITVTTGSQAPHFTDGPPPSSATVGTAYSFTYTASGSPAPTFSVTSGSLPTGLTLSAAGVISGTPTAAGTFTGTVMASNGVSPNATQNFTITVTSGSQAPHFTDGPPPSSATVGTAYSFTYSASGSPAPTFSVTSGALPGGLTLSAAGVISGTPIKPGTFTGTVTASNGVSPNATQNFTITVAASGLAAANASSTAAGTTGTSHPTRNTSEGVLSNATQTAPLMIASASSPSPTLSSSAASTAPLTASNPRASVHDIDALFANNQNGLLDAGALDQFFAHKGKKLHT